MLAIQHCDTYHYLGSIFTCDGRARTAVKEHAKCAKKYLMKLIAFFKCNTDMPFIVKKEGNGRSVHVCYYVWL